MQSLCPSNRTCVPSYTCGGRSNIKWAERNSRKPKMKLHLHNNHSFRKYIAWLFWQPVLTTCAILKKLVSKHLAAGYLLHERQWLWNLAEENSESIGEVHNWKKKKNLFLQNRRAQARVFTENSKLQYSHRQVRQKCISSDNRAPPADGGAWLEYLLPFPRCHQGWGKSHQTPSMLHKFGLFILPAHCQSAPTTTLKPEQHGTRQPQKLDDTHQGRKNG